MDNPNQQSPAPAGPTPAANGPGRGWSRVLAALLVLAVLAAGLAGYWYRFRRGIVFTDDARLAGHLVDVAPEVGGRLATVGVREGQAVRQGDVLFRLDPATAQTALQQAAAAVVTARANLALSQVRSTKAKNGSRPEEIKAAAATVRRLRNEEDLARLEVDRELALRQKGIAAQEDLDRLRSALESAKQTRENATQNLALLQQGTRPEDLAAAEAEVALAQSQVAEADAAVAKARRNLDLCTVAAPFAGCVVRRWLDPGAIALPGQPVVSLFDPATLRVDANIEEKYLNAVAIGDVADIRVDAYPGLRLQGRVTEILRATNSKFSLIPAEGVSGTYIKVTQRVPLRLTVMAPPDLPLGPGLSTEVRIHVGAAARPPAGGEAADGR